MRSLFTLFFISFLTGKGIAQISITTLNTAMTQDFATMSVSSCPCSAMPTHWVFTESGTGANTTYAANSGTATTGDTYNFWTGSGSDFSIGTLQSGSVATTFGTRYTNNSGTTITQLDIAYYGEYWRCGATGRIDQLDFAYSLNATSLSTGTWTDVNALDFDNTGLAASCTTSIAAKAGNTTCRKQITASITGLSIADGSTFWIRWSDLNATGADDGMAVDDYSLTAVGAVACAAPTLSASTSTANTATLSIDVTANVSGVGGGTNITERGIHYSTSSSLATPSTNSQTGASLGTGNFTRGLSSLTANTLYYYRGFAINDCATPQTGYSHTSSYPTFITLPPAPAGLSAGTPTSGGFPLSWTNITTGTEAETYTVEVYNNSGYTGVAAATYNTAANASSQTVAGLSGGTEYWYRIQAVNGGGSSTWTNGASSIFTLNSITPGTLPMTVACVSAVTGYTFNLPFTSVGTFNALNDYTVELSSSTGSFSSPILVGTLSDNNSNSGNISVTIPANSSNGSGYLLRIKSNNPAVTSSSTASFTVNLGPDNAQWSSSTVANSQVTLVWTNPGNCFDELVIVAATSAVSGTPSGTVTPSSVYATPSAAELNGYVVYAGNGATPSQLVTGLTNGQLYYFEIFTRYGTDWSSGVSVSLTPNNNPTAIMRWEMAGLSGSEVTKSYDVATAGVSTTTPSGVLSRGSGVTAGANSDRFNSSAWTTSASIDVNDYLEFSIAPASGYQVSLTGIKVNLERSANGPSTVAVKSSMDNYTATIQTLTSVPSAGGPTTYNVSLSGFDNLTQTVTFRLYGYGAVTSAGTFGIESATSYDLDILGFVITNTADMNVKAGPTTGNVSIADGGSYDFGVYKTGTSSSAVNFRIENVGSVPLNLTGSPKVAISGTDAAAFSIVQTSLPASIGANSSASFTVAFTASGSSGSRSAQLSIDNGSGDASEVPYVINLTAEVGVVPVINEFVQDHNGTDDHEFIEVFGAANTSYNNMKLVVVRGDGSIGTVNRIYSLTSTNASGYWWTGFLNSELLNGTKTILLVMNCTGAVNDDLDTNDDGTLDVTPWSRIVDDVSLRTTGSDKVYSSTIIFPNFDGTFLTPGGASRIPNGTDTDNISDWMRSDFDGWGLGLTGVTPTANANEAKNSPNDANSRFNVWLGGTTNWNTGTNWTVGVPSSTLEALIPTIASSNYPVISTIVTYDCMGLYFTSTSSNITLSAGAEIRNYGDFESNSSSTSFGAGTITFEGSTATKISGTFTIGELTINNSSGVTIQPGAIVNITDKLILESGQLTNSGTLNLKSSATKTAYIDDFTDPTPGTLSGNVTLERFIPPTSGSNIFHYIGAVSSASASSKWGDDFVVSGTTGYVTPSNCDPASPSLAQGSNYGGFFSYHENNVTDCYLKGWYVEDGNYSLTPGKGVAARIGNGIVLDETGTYPTSVSNVTVSNLTTTSSNNVSYSKGYNLVANPFYAPLDFAGIITDLNNDVDWDGSVFIYDPSSGSYSAYNFLSSNPSTINTNQAFFIRADAGITQATNLDFVFSKSRRTAASNTTFYRQSQQYEYGLNITVENSGKTDATIIAFDEVFTHSFDRGYDAMKLYNDVGIPSLYTKSGSDQQAIQALPLISGNTRFVPLSILITTSGTHTFTFDGIQDFPATTIIWLEDLQTGVMQDLRQNGTYTFAANVHDNNDRFILHFTAPIITTAKAATCAGGDGEISLQLPLGVDWSFIIENEFGAVVSRQTAIGATVIVDALRAGIYFATFTHAGSYQVIDTIVVTGAQQVEADFFSALDNPVVNEVIQFTNNSTGATSYEWDFGDGTIVSGANNPTHAYQAEGTYLVTLRAANVDCKDVETTEIQVGKQSTVGLNSLDGNSLSVFTHDGNLYVKFDFDKTGVAEIIVNNLLGQQIFSDRTNMTGLQIIHLPPTAAAQYLLVSIKTSSEVFVRKIFLSSVE